jgi:DNA-binding transcriptional regulator YiaG
MLAEMNKRKEVEKDGSTPAEETLYTEVLLRAASSVGSTQQLARRLGVPHGQLRLWMRGEKVPPPHILFATVNLLEKYH